MGLTEIGMFATVFLLIIGVSVLVGAIVLRASVSLLNRMSGVKGHDQRLAVEESRPRESMNVAHPPDQTNPYAAPADYVPRPLPGVSGRGVPSPSYGKSLGIMVLFTLFGTAASWLVTLAFYPASVFWSLGEVVDVVAALATYVAQFFVMAGLVTVMLPTKFGKACLVTLLVGVISVAIGLVVGVTLALVMMMAM